MNEKPTKQDIFIFCSAVAYGAIDSFLDFI